MADHPVPGKNAEERVENRIRELHAQLRITSAEEPQWNQFAEVMRDNARSMDQAFKERAQSFESMNAVQNMQSYEKLAQAHAQDLEKLVPAFQNLYDAMPDQQKQLADQVFRTNAEQHAQQRAVRLPRFSGRFVSLQSTSWSWRPACRLRRLSVSGIPGPNATAPDYTNPRCS